MTKAKASTTIKKKLDQDRSKSKKPKKKPINQKESCVFPLEVFPKPVQEIILAFNEAYNLPISFFGLSMMTTFAGSIGTDFRLKVKNGYYAPPILYSVLVGDSSVGKSPVMDHCLAPLYKKEEEYHKEYLEEIAMWDADMSGTKKKPFRKDLLMADLTVESVSMAMSRNPKGLIAHQDEFDGFMRSMNQYRKGADEQYWLKNWNGKRHKVNRATKDTIFLKRNSVSIIGGIQPKLLANISVGGKMDNGFFARLLFAYPDKKKMEYDTDIDVPKKVFEQYEKFVNRLYGLRNEVQDKIEVENRTTIDVKLGKEAKKLYKKWNKRNVDLINEANADFVMSFYKKLGAYCYRFALILELLDIAVHEEELDKINFEINKITLERAIKLAEYFRKTFFKVLTKIEFNSPLDNMMKSKADWYKNLNEEFTTAEACKKGEEFQMSVSTVKRLLREKELFEKVSYGLYSKCL